MPRKRLKQKWRLSDTGDQDGVIVLITGSNAGIGFEMAMEFAGKGAEVILGCRSLQRAEGAKERILGRHPEGRVHLLELDLADLKSVEAGCCRGHGKLPPS